jgi:imidazole glycerol-phosphate synthase subunit HisH
MRIAIVNYGSGNLGSAAAIFRHVAGNTGTAITLDVTDDPKIIAAADRVVLPGVGAFADCKRGLTSVPGVLDAMREQVFVKQRPFLGICVGMQLLADAGEEHGVSDGLKWIGGRVQKITPSDPKLKIPHMGWNTIEVKKPHPVFNGLSDMHFYFVHSYHFKTENPSDIAATVDYAQTITAAIARDNIVATQFHPEKSQSAGKALIGNFLRWNP